MLCCAGDMRQLPGLLLVHSPAPMHCDTSQVRQELDIRDQNVLKAERTASACAPWQPGRELFREQRGFLRNGELGGSGPKLLLRHLSFSPGEKESRDWRFLVHTPTGKEQERSWVLAIRGAE